MMKEEKEIMFKNRLGKVFRHAGRQAKRQGITCFRIYDHDLPDFPFCIEIYEDNLYVAEYRRKHKMHEDEHEDWLQSCIDIVNEVTGIKKENIFLKQRQKKAGRLGQYQKTGDRKSEFIVTENGLKFIVNLSDYLDTGLFLDHRITRKMVAEESKEKKVLNLFCYTGSFSVYAAAGGADEIISVDLSKTYLHWAQRNMDINGFTNNRFQFVQSDVKQYLQSLPADYFDLVILDPPTFSNSQRMKDFLDIQKDHVQLINDCLVATKPGGEIFFSTNYKKFHLEKEKINTPMITDITKATTPFDFERKLFRYCFKIRK